jgi:hypothetical protein
MADESPFTIRDRRRAQEDPVPLRSSGPQPATDPVTAVNPPHPADTTRGAASPPATFSALIIGLGTSAFAALGVQSAPAEESSMNAPVTGGHPNNLASHLAVDLDHARHLIDLLGVLELKTARNLTPDEQQLLQQLLYTLRLTFVERSRSGPVAPPGGAR